MRRLDLLCRNNGLLGASSKRLLLSRSSAQISQGSRGLSKALSGAVGSGPTVSRTNSIYRYSTSRLSSDFRAASFPTVRVFSTAPALREAQRAPQEEPKSPAKRKDEDGEDDELVERAFARTEKASQAAKVNLRARLSKEGASKGGTAGFSEVWRLIKIARPEARWLGCTKCVP